MMNKDSWTAAVGVLAVVGAVQAAPVVDQSFVGPFTSDAQFGSQYRAQTFTVGVSGLLTRFDVYLNPFNDGSGSAGFQIWNTTGGSPAAIPGVALASASIAFSGPDGWFGADVAAAGLEVMAGDVLALVQVANSNTGAAGFWRSGVSANATYAGGQAFTTSVFDPSGAWIGSTDQDRGFRVYVDPDAAAVPTPPTVALVGLGLAGLAALRRGRTLTPT